MCLIDSGCWGQICSLGIAESSNFMLIRYKLTSLFGVKKSVQICLSFFSSTNVLSGEGNKI